MMQKVRTTVSIDDELLKRAKVHAAESGRTLGQVLEDGLRMALVGRREPREPLVPLPTYGGTGVQPGIDLTSNTALRDRMDEEVDIDALR